MEHPKPHKITDHQGVLSVHTGPDPARVEIEFDSSKLSESDLRAIVQEHLRPEPQGIQKYALRLDGQACEAAAAKLERRIEKNVPGVRKATATYIGRVLCLTFDPAVSPAATVLQGVESAGAKVRSLDTEAEAARATLWQKIRLGERNEEISCILGFGFLVAAFVVDSLSGQGPWTTALYAGAYLFNGQQGVRSAWASLREKTLDVDVLMVLAAIGAAIVGSPFEGALLLFLFSFSNVLQRYALARTQRAIESLLTLRPETALVRRGGQAETVPVEQLVPGDVVIVRPGEHIPADGTVVEGRSNLDESSLTGESMPVSKSVGSPVFAGTVNQSGGLEISVCKRSEDSTLAQMVRLVAEAQAEKSKTQRFLERAEQYYAAGVIAFTFLVLCVPWLIWGEAFSTAFYRAMTVMVVASPCALIISTPATVLSAIGGAARRGILIKGGSYLEEAARIDIVAIDKTGTLTKGKPAVTEIIDDHSVHAIGQSALPSTVAALWKIAASLEFKSEHPLARAIVEGAGQRGLDHLATTGFQATPGRGAEATVDGRRFVMGSERLFRELQAEKLEGFLALKNPLEARGKTCVWLGEWVDGRVVSRAIFALADTLRPEARALAASLHALGVKRVVMLTGDQPAVASAIASEAGLDEFRAGLLPEDKVRAIRQLKSEGRVMMIGDGVNDAPALASADLSVAMGAAGTDIAMETADVVLMGDKLENIPTLLGLARHARRVLIQNLVFATSVIVILLAAALGFALPLPLGVVGHEGSTVLVCLNGLRLLIYQK